MIFYHNMIKKPKPNKMVVLVVRELNGAGRPVSVHMLARWTGTEWQGLSFEGEVRPVRWAYINEWNGDINNV